MFDLSGTNGSYPVYDRDSLLNTNPQFDYGAFRALATTSPLPTSFPFAFPDAGVYVFYSSSQVAMKSVVRVMAAGQVCPTDGSITPMTTSTLVQLGVKRTAAVVVSPNWGIVAAVLGSLVAAAAAAALWLYCLHTAEWERRWRGTRLYARAAAAVSLTALRTLGTSVSEHVVMSVDTVKRVEPFFPPLPSAPPQGGDVDSAIDAVGAAPPSRRSSVVGVGLWDQEDTEPSELEARVRGVDDDAASRIASAAAATDAVGDTLRAGFTELRRVAGELSLAVLQAEPVQARAAVVKVLLPLCCSPPHSRSHV